MFPISKYSKPSLSLTKGMLFSKHQLAFPKARGTRGIQQAARHWLK